MQQITNTILMIRPVSFRMNKQTSINNFYQKEIEGLSEKEIQKRALFEFDPLVEKLKEAGVNIIVVKDTKEPDTPDSIFPNNWISFHQNNTVAIYPMFAKNRRNERREAVIDLIEENGFRINDVVDYTAAEEETIYLEGTGSLVLDRQNKIAYCALSPRANEDLFIEFCEDFEYMPIIFHAYQTVNKNKGLIYHTNVMMNLTEKSAIICLDVIANKKERKMVLNWLMKSGKKIVTISEDQVDHFAGNMIQVCGKDQEKYMVMSKAAFDSLNKNQIQNIEEESTILYSNIKTIETCGGGSVRCMMGEVFLKPY